MNAKQFASGCIAVWFACLLSGFTGTPECAEPAVNEELRRASREARVDEVNALLSQGAEVASRDRWGCNALDYACRKGYRELAEALLAHGADANGGPDGGNCYRAAALCDATVNRCGKPLHLAASGGFLDVAKLLLAYGATVNVWNEGGETPLHSACRNNKPQMVGLLVANGADVNATPVIGTTKAHSPSMLNHGGTPLHIACRWTGIDTVRLLLDHGAKVKVEDSLGRTPLHEAVAGGSADVIELLLAKGADLKVKDEHGMTPLYFACGNGPVETVKLLLDHGANLQTRDNMGRTPFFSSVAAKKPDVVKFLLLKGSNVNDRDKQGKTPLHVACSGPRSVPVVSLLIAEGAHFNVADDQGRTPLHLAAEVGSAGSWGYCRQPELVAALLSAGADVHSVDRFGFTPLHGPANHGCSRVVEELLGKDRTLSREEQTALHAAALDGQLKIAEILLSRGADVNARYSADYLTMMRLPLGDSLFEEVCRDYSNWSDKGMAWMRHHLWLDNEIVRKLVTLTVLREAGFTSRGATALHFACFTGQTEMVQFLLSKGASVNAADAQGHAALHVACAIHNCRAVKELLASGADVNAKDRAGLTPYDWMKKMDSAVHSLEGTPKHKFFSTAVKFNKASTRQLLEVLETHGAKPSIKKDDAASIAK